MLNTRPEEVQRIKDQADLLSLEKYLPELIHFHYNPQQPLLYDENLLQGTIDMLSMALEYYNYSNNYLQNGVETFEQQIKIIERENKNERREIQQLSKDIRKNNQFLKLRKNAFEKYQNFIETSQQYKCDTCNKSDVFLQKHMNRRHNPDYKPPQEPQKNQPLRTNDDQLQVQIQKNNKEIKQHLEQFQRQIDKIQNMIQNVHVNTDQVQVQHRNSQQDMKENLEIIHKKISEIRLEKTESKPVYDQEKLRKIEDQQKNIQQMTEQITSKQWKYYTDGLEKDVPEKIETKNEFILNDNKKLVNETVKNKYQNTHVTTSEVDHFLESLEDQLDMTQQPKKKIENKDTKLEQNKDQNSKQFQSIKTENKPPSFPNQTQKYQQSPLQKNNTENDQKQPLQRKITDPIFDESKENKKNVIKEETEYKRTKTMGAKSKALNLDTMSDHHSDDSNKKDPLTNKAHIDQKDQLDLQNQINIQKNQPSETKNLPKSEEPLRIKDPEEMKEDKKEKTQEISQKKQVNLKENLTINTDPQIQTTPNNFLNTHPKSKEETSSLKVTFLTQNFKAKPPKNDYVLDPDDEIFDF